MDKEKVAKAIELLDDFFNEYRAVYDISPHEAWKIIKDTLKEQEAVVVHDPGAYCPKCGWMLYPEDHPHHCGNCGQAVKWNEETNVP